jgi:hypothetical protein
MVSANINAASTSVCPVKMTKHEECLTAQAVKQEPQG